VDLGSLKKDKHYRRYASSVERALSLFDNALQEWADYISFLSRLLKVRTFRPVETMYSIADNTSLGASNPSTRSTSRPPQSTCLEATGPVLEPIATIRRAPESPRSLHIHIWIDQGMDGQINGCLCVY
jgi:hypothetical protein